MAAERSSASTRSGGSSALTLPAQLEGNDWKIGRLSLWTLSLATFVFVALALFSRDEPEWGAAIALSVLGLLLLLGGFRIRRTRLLDVDDRGLVVHGFWGDRHVLWTQICAFEVTRLAGEGITRWMPTLRLANRRRRVHLTGFAEGSRTRSRAEELVDSLRATQIACAPGALSSDVVP